MNNTFLDRFQGKTKTITKLGLENVLKGPTDTVVYTNTHKSFGIMPPHHFHKRKNTEEDSKLQQKSQNGQSQKQKQTLHLPSIGERYSSHKNSNLDLSGRSLIKGFHDKQTNWIIDNQIRSTFPQKIVPIKETQEQNLKENSAKVEKKSKKLQKRSSSTKYERLGGLGANIGSQQWQIRRNKQQKATNYAQQLRKIQRQKYSKAQTESTTLKSNLKFL